MSMILYLIGAVCLVAAPILVSASFYFGRFD
jgi:hypothetical protein